MENLILRLYEIQAVKFGNFVLKSGISSPVYFDLRVIISYPDALKLVSNFIWNTMQEAGCQYKSVCGVPYTALPIATCICASHDIPMLIRRKEAKDYGTKKMIEGHFEPADQCLIIEDVVTSGASVLETVKSLTNVGLKVKDAIVLLDREQGGRQRLRDHGITLHSVCTVTQLLSILEQHNKLSQEIVSNVRLFVQEHNTYIAEEKGKEATDLMMLEQRARRKVFTYAERAALAIHPLTKRLFTLMDEKKTNLAFSADVTSSHQLLQLANTVGPYICVLKTHIDIIEDFSPEVTVKLRELSLRHGFIIFEDRKFADIGSTVKHQFTGGVHRISQWADLINAHGIPGPGVIKGLKEAARESTDYQCQGCLLVAEMSSEGNLAVEDYTKKVVEMAENYGDFVVGFISQSKLSPDPKYVHMTPGVRLQQGDDELGQRYMTPADVVTHRGSDVIIVGRGIILSAEPAYAAKQYQEAGYAAHLCALQS